MHTIYSQYINDWLKTIQENAEAKNDIGSYREISV